MKRAFSLCAVGLKNQIPAMACNNLIPDLKEWKFKDTPNYAQLPINDNPKYNEPVAVKNAIFSKVPIEPLTGNVSLVCVSKKALSEILDLDPSVAEDDEFINFINGKYLPDGALTVSHRYGGYQFGHWADQLGDGRAHILGEYVNSKGESWQPQLKGSGETPYSRFGDGRAVLRSSIREMIASEACHFIGLPSTRAVALVVSDEHKVWRDKSYSGHAKPERAAVVMRAAPAWYRLGSFEILLKRNELELMKTFLDFVIKHHFPHIENSDKDKYVEFYSEVAHKNLDLVAKWQGVGFAHGVLNTDNVSILGLTIDYGPYGFLDKFEPHFVPNTSDDMARYAFNKQSEMMIWNLHKFAETLSPILTEEQRTKVKEIEDSLENYSKYKILSMYLMKLGLTDIQRGDHLLVDDLLEIMENAGVDFTVTFRQITDVYVYHLLDQVVLTTKWALNQISNTPAWDMWVKDYWARLESSDIPDETRRERMRKVNPVYIPRNWMLQDAIKDAENDDFEKTRFLLEILSNPFERNEEAERRGFSAPAPSWAYGLKLSCSS